MNLPFNGYPCSLRCCSQYVQVLALTLYAVYLGQKLVYHAVCNPRIVTSPNLCLFSVSFERQHACVAPLSRGVPSGANNVEFIKK